MLTIDDFLTDSQKADNEDVSPIRTFTNGAAHPKTVPEEGLPRRVAAAAAVRSRDPLKVPGGSRAHSAAERGSHIWRVLFIIPDYPSFLHLVVIFHPEPRTPLSQRRREGEGNEFLTPIWVRLPFQISANSHAFLPPPRTPGLETGMQTPILIPSY